MTKYLALSFMLGVVSVPVWTWAISMLYGNIYFPIFDPGVGTPTAESLSTGFWLFGAISSSGIAFIVSTILGLLTPAHHFRNWLLFLAGFCLMASFGLLVTGGQENLQAFWVSPNTWVFIVSSLLAVCVGRVWGLRITRRST